MSVPCSELPRLAVIENKIEESEKREERLNDTLEKLDMTLQDFRVEMARLQTRYQVIVGGVGIAATAIGGLLEHAVLKF